MVLRTMHVSNNSRRSINFLLRNIPDRNSRPVRGHAFSGPVSVSLLGLSIDTCMFTFYTPKTNKKLKRGFVHDRHVLSTGGLLVSLQLEPKASDMKLLRKARKNSLRRHILGLSVPTFLFCSKLLVSPLISPIVVPYIIPYITPLM